MSLKKPHKNYTNKKYYILDLSFAITPMEDYKFNKKEDLLQSLVNSECFLKNPKCRDKKIKLEKMINEMGFEWEPLSEPGHMRQMPYAVTIMEAIEKYAWLAIEKFSNEQDFPLYRVSGGELFDSDSPEIKKQILLISKYPELYGSNQYNVVINKKKRILRYNACIQKLSIAKGINLCKRDLPVGLFEISKSYRFEEENELQLCKRVRNFRIPELDVINDSLASSLKMALAAHIRMLDEIKKLDPECEILCSVTNDFFKKNFDFLKTIVKSINKPILLAIYGDVRCKDGVKIDVEYKVFDNLKSPVEIATFLVDDGATEFSLDLKFKTKSCAEKPVSTLHIVFPFGSVERSAYFLLDRAIKKEAKSGFRQLPLWAAPIQVRIISHDKGCLEDAKKLIKELNSSNFRVDLDDRKIHYNAKKKAKDLKWIPYVVTVGKNNKGLHNLSVENKMKGIFRKTMKKSDLIKELRAEEGRNIIVPRYTPMLLSKKEIFNS